ncbi:MAG: hypothetical protein NFCOHLIN_00850 [Gammaproteobacteria bacterium]|nr:hypothetical protein [Gammaproteobacteria bacterium]
MGTGIEHFDSELYAIDERIGRLALACGVPLADMPTIVALIKGDYTVCRHGDNPKRQELRALLMMKYGIEERCLAALGHTECLRLIADHEDRLRARGLLIEPTHTER